MVTICLKGIIALIAPKTKVEFYLFIFTLLKKSVTLNGLVRDTERLIYGMVVKAGWGHISICVKCLNPATMGASNKGLQFQGIGRIIRCLIMLSLY